MDLRQLKYFIAVAEEGHLGRAAQRLHLSQPPLSRQIQALEAELGTALFERQARGMVLTQAGQSLLQDARHLQALAAQAAQRAQRAGRGEAGRLDLGVYGSALFGVVPALLARFAAAHPAVELVLHPAPTPQQVLALRQGRVQLVLERQLPDPAHQAGLQIELVAREPVCVALPAGHALAAQAAVPLAALRDETLMTGSAPYLTAQLVAQCQAQGFEPRLSAPVADVLMATVMVACRRGVALVPQSMAQVAMPGVVYRPLQGPVEAAMPVHAFWRADQPSPQRDALLALAREALATDALAAEAPVANAPVADAPVAGAPVAGAPVAMAARAPAAAGWPPAQPR